MLAGTSGGHLVQSTPPAPAQTGPPVLVAQAHVQMAFEHL